MRGCIAIAVAALFLAAVPSFVLDRKLAACRAQLDGIKIAHAKQQSANTIIEKDRALKIQEVKRNASLSLSKIDTHRAHAAAAGNRLRQSNGDTHSGAGYTTSTDTSQTSGAADGLQSDLLRGAHESEEELAAIADEARARGLACQASYDALTTYK